MKKKVGIIGGGNFGTAISNILALSIKEKQNFDSLIKVWIFDEQVDTKNGRMSICDYINEYKENIKYLPDVKLPDNLVFVTKECDYLAMLKESDILIFVLPTFIASKFVDDLVKNEIKNKIIVSLMKGFITLKDDKGDKPVLFSDYVKDKLNSDCSVVMGANIANDMNKDLCEMTIATKSDEKMLQDLFTTQNTKVSVIDDVKSVELYAALKNIVAIAYGITIGLNLSVNTVMSILRKGILEMIEMAKIYDKSTDCTTMFESCGIPDLMVSCLHGRNSKGGFRIANEKIKVSQIEKEMNGQVMHGVSTIKKVYPFIKSLGKENDFKLFCCLYSITVEDSDPSCIIRSIQ